MQVVEQWRKPKHEEFRERTVWSAFNAFTEVAKIAPVLELPRRTMRLQGLTDQLAGIVGTATPEAGEDSEVIER
jgi:hypothetical protein